MIGGNNYSALAGNVLGVSPSDLPEQAAYHSDARLKKTKHRFRERSRIASRAVAPRSLIDAGRNIQELILIAGLNLLAPSIQIEISLPSCLGSTGDSSFIPRRNGSHGTQSALISSNRAVSVRARRKRMPYFRRQKISCLSQFRSLTYAWRNHLGCLLNLLTLL